MPKGTYFFAKEILCQKNYSNLYTCIYTNRVPICIGSPVLAELAKRSLQSCHAVVSPSWKTVDAKETHTSSLASILCHTNVYEQDKQLHPCPFLMTSSRFQPSYRGVLLHLICHCYPAYSTVNALLQFYCSLLKSSVQHDHKSPKILLQ